MASEKRVIVDMIMGEPIPMDALIHDLAKARIIYLGEIHTIARHHAVQVEVLQALHDSGVKLGLGLEVLGADRQPVLDKWQSGSENFAHLMRDLGREQWTNLKDYEPLLVLARKLKAPIRGLNASDLMVRKVAREGVEALTERERAELPERFEKINPQYDRLLRLRLRVHKAFQSKSLDRIVLAQALRDGTMAQAIVRFLQSPGGRDRAMLVVCGTGHLNYGFGIPEAVERVIKLPSRIVLPSESGELVLSEEEKRQSVPVEISHQDLGFIRSRLADYLIVTPLESPPKDNGDPGFQAAR